MLPRRPGQSFSKQYNDGLQTEMSLYKKAARHLGLERIRVRIQNRRHPLLEIPRLQAQLRRATIDLPRVNVIGL